MRFLQVDEILELHRLLLEQSGGNAGLLSMNALQSALAQPSMTFDGQDLYPSIIEKGAALAPFLSSIITHSLMGISALDTLRLKCF
jgi:prophage maintenance system killer protein